MPAPLRLVADNLTGPLAHHAEGPVWWPGWGGLRYVDLAAGALLTVREHGVDRLQLEDPIAAFVRPRAGGGYVVGVERGLALASGPDELPERVLTLWDDPAVRMNDGGTDPAGRLLAGSMAYDASAGAASLYRIDAGLGVETVLESVTISNGVAFSPDGRTCYYVDTATHRIDRFDVDDAAELGGRRPFVSIDPADGAPDGLTVAADGSVWVALWGGSCVHGYDADGTLRAVVEVGARQVSACTFGGPALDELFITTSRQGIADGDEPEAGSVFVARPGVAGLPVTPFAG